MTEGAYPTGYRFRVKVVGKTTVYDAARIWFAEMVLSEETGERARVLRFMCPGDVSETFIKPEDVESIAIVATEEPTCTSA